MLHKHYDKFKYMMNFYKRFKHSIISIVRREIGIIVKQQLVNFQYRNYCRTTSDIGVNPNCEDIPVIVSLTTYGKRINDVALTIESIFRQTIKANRIILWLDENEFTLETIPIILKTQIDRGLEIRFCENIKSYKKIIPTLRFMGNAHIITVDDDIIYPEFMIESFLRKYRNNSKCVYFFEGRIVSKKSNGEYRAYSKWKIVDSYQPLDNVLPTGVGSVFYPEGCFDKRVTNSQLFMDLCPNADDIWLRFMTKLNGYPCSKVEMLGSFKENFIEISGGQDIALSKTNYFRNTNDKQLNNLVEYFQIQI